MKIRFSVLSLFVVFFLLSCGSGDELTDDGSYQVFQKKPSVKVSETQLTDNGYDFCRISVNDPNGIDVTAFSTIYVDNSTITGDTYYPSASGSHQIKARYQNQFSDILNIQVNDAGLSKYKQKVLVEDYTGAWCGHCPRVTTKLASLVSEYPEIVPVGIHNNDAMAFSQESQLRNRWGIDAFPGVMVNRSFKWQESDSEITQLLNKWMPLGLSVNSSLNGSVLSVKVSIEFNITSDKYPMTLTVFLLENKLSAPQTNYGYSTPYGNSTTLFKYVHNWVLRKSATSVFGDPIPVASIVKNTTYEVSFSFDTTGFNLNNCDVVAFVSHADNSSKQGVINVQKISAMMGNSQN